MDLSGLLIDAINRHRAGDRAGVAERCAEVLALSPDNPTALRLAGLSHDDPAGARRLLERAHAARPLHPPTALALALSLLRTGEPAAALAIAGPITGRDPAVASAWFVAGSAYSALGRTPEAVAGLTVAQRLDPDHAETATNLGNALLDADDLVGAELWLRRAITIDGGQPETWASLGFLLAGQGRAAAAVAACDAALRLRPGFATAHWNRAYARLLAGDYAAAWADFEWRWADRHPPRGLPPGPRWDGRDPPDGRLLVLAEQGLGDTIQFVRFLPGLAARMAVTLVCPPSLHRLLAGLPVTLRAPGGELPDDPWVNLMSVPALLGTTLATLPGTSDYLPCATKSARRRPRVGVVWRGNPEHSNDRRRSLPTEALRPLTTLDGIELVSLQVGRLAHQAASVLGIVTLGARNRDWADTAELIATCDLVVSADTSSAHLAGAMGVPVWVLLPFMPDWRWGVGCADTPWYASARLFRQQTPGDWTTVVAAVATELAEVCHASATVAG